MTKKLAFTIQTQATLLGAVYPLGNTVVKSLNQEGGTQMADPGMMAQPDQRNQTVLVEIALFMVPAPGN